MKYFIALAFLLVSKLSISQNTFPASGYVGIGTTSPTSNLTINGTGSIGAEILTDATSSSRPVLTFQRGSGFWNIGMNMNAGNTNDFHFRYNGTTYPFTIQAATGNVGIGTISPRGQFDVAGAGDIYLVSNPVAGTTQTAYLPGHIYFSPYNGTDWSYIQARRSDNSGSTNFQFRTFSAGVLINAMAIVSNGSVGIGTTSPDAKLAVAGQVHAQEVKVSITVPGPDYVFDKDYELTSLDDIKTYIDQNNHLPEVPSAKEMEKNGVQLGEMNMLLLRKIEELTLHLIEQNKFIEQLKEERRTSPDPSGKKIEELTLYLIELKKENDEQNKVNAFQESEIGELRKKLDENLSSKTK